MTLRFVVFGDASAMSPGGVRLGTPALTSRGLKEADFERIAEFLDRAVKMCLIVQENSGKRLVDFKKGLNEESCPGLAAFHEEVKKFARSFYMPGAGFDRFNAE